MQGQGAAAHSDEVGPNKLIGRFRDQQALEAEVAWQSREWAARGEAVHSV